VTARRSSGREFHSDEPAYAKVCSPNLVRNGGSEKSVDDFAAKGSGKDDVGDKSSSPSSCQRRISYDMDAHGQSAHRTVVKNVEDQNSCGTFAYHAATHPIEEN